LTEKICTRYAQGRRNHAMQAAMGNVCKPGVKQPADLDSIDQKKLRAKGNSRY